MFFYGFLFLLSFCLADQAAENTATLTKLSNYGKEIIAFDSDSFKKATKGPRNYALFVILTALNPQFNCQPCKILQKEFQDLQYSVSKSVEKGRIFVGFLDYSAATQDIFVSMNLQNVPHVRLYYPNAGPHAKDTDFEVITFTALDDGSAEGLAKLLNQKLGTFIKSSKPFDWQKYIAVATGAISVVALGAVLVANSSRIFDVSKIGAHFVVVFSTFMCSGYMWNTIRNPPFLGTGEKGEPLYFSGTQQHQFGVEPMIITVLYCSASLVFGLLFGLVPRISNPTVQRVTVYVCISMFYVIYSVILRIFRIKNGGYPFKVLF